MKKRLPIILVIVVALIVSGTMLFKKDDTSINKVDVTSQIETNQEKSNDNQDNEIQDDASENNDKNDKDFEKVLENAVSYINNKTDKQEWDIIALKVAGQKLDSINTDKLIKKYDEEKQRFQLTDYAKTLLAITALNENPVESFDENLIEITKQKLEEEKTLINACAWGIIALESVNSEYDKASVIDFLESQQNNDGSFEIIAGQQGNSNEPDITAMVVSSMIMAGKDKEYPAVKKGLNNLKNYIGQVGNGEVDTNLEALSQILIAAIISGDDLEQYKIGDNELVDEIISYSTQDGSFMHLKNGKGNDISTQQAVIALSMYKNNRNLYYELANEELIKEIKNNEEVANKNKEEQETDKQNNEKVKVELNIIGYKNIILSDLIIEINDGDTIEEVVKRALDKKGIDYKIESNYISMIDGEYESDKGALSGWRFSVNNIFPNERMSDYVLSENDKIKLIFAENPNDNEGIYYKSLDSDKDVLEDKNLESNQEIESNTDVVINSGNTKITISSIDGGKFIVENEQMKDIAINIYDESENIVYINLDNMDNGRKELELYLDKGIYHGVINGSQIDKINIPEFKVK